jgi:hypothetical protein
MKNFKNFITENQLINEIGETSAGLEKLQKLNKRLYGRATFYNKRIGKIKNRISDISSEVPMVASVSPSEALGMVEKMKRLRDIMSGDEESFDKAASRFKKFEKNINLMIKRRKEST